MESGGQPPVPGGFPPVEPKPGEQPTPEPPRPSGGTQSPLGAQSDAGDPFAEHPEIFVGAAFAGGFVMAKILGRLGR